MIQNPSKPPVKIFDVLIRDKKYDVYSIEGKEHAGLNNEPKQWWLYYTDRVPEGTVPPRDSEHFVPWSTSIKRIVWEIKLKVNNTSKFKWDEHRFSHNCSCEIWANGKHVYSFVVREMEFALTKANYLLVHLAEHPYSFLDQESQNGRKIYWYGLPATVRPSTSYPGEIGIVPDYTAMTKQQWWKEYHRRKSKIAAPPEEMDDVFREHDEEAESDDFINWGDALSDGNIDWFRE